MAEYVQVFSQTGALLGVLENAQHGYELKHNDLWTGTIVLPAEDPKNALCQPHNLVRLPDGPRDTGLFRIIGEPGGELTADGGTITYTVEHVMATLLDDLIFQYREWGGDGVSRRTVMENILAQQTVERWQLGEVDFTDHFQYHFENVSLLDALLSTAGTLADEYTWVFDTGTVPWTVSLKRADADPGCGVYFGRNLKSVQRSMDASALITRLYPLGYGEGVNQLTIAEANSGVPYLDADTAGTWGIKTAVWTDTRIQDADTLKAKAEAILQKYKDPVISYTVSAIDLFRLTGYSWDNVMPGKLVKVRDGMHGVAFDARVKSISKSDVNGDPGSISITIANSPEDAADALNDLANRVGIGELYSQGATNLFTIPYMDNADEDHPAKMRFFVPSGCVRINRMLLSWQLSAFRAYETGADAGGGGTHTTTTKESEVATSEAAGDASITKEIIVTVSATCGSPVIGGTEQTTTGAAGAHDHSVDSHHHSIAAHAHSVSSGSSMTGTWQGGTQNTSPGTSVADDHVHGMNHTHQIGAYATVPELQVNVPAHTHTLTIPGHRHSVTLPTHNHGIVYGIFEGDTAESVTIKVDGTSVPAAETELSEIDVSAYLEKDANGKIRRNAWHEIQIVPDGLTRIEATLAAQVFIQSVGGGDY